MSAIIATSPAASAELASTRRDFLTIAGATFAAVGAGASLWPVLDSFNPSSSTRAEAKVEVDLKPIAPGQMISLLWQGKTVFIVHRTPAQIVAAEAGDSEGGVARTPDSSRVKRKEWLVLVGVCTHLGCIPTARGSGDLAPRYGGWVCPCHYSQYDGSGRVRRGPAPRDLDVPPYQFDGSDRLVIG